MNFNFNASNIAGKLNKDKGTIEGISLISTGEAKGHGMTVDLKTLTGIFELTKGKVLKAFWTHGQAFSGDRLGEEVGLFSGFHIVGTQLKARFTVLEAFRRTYSERFDYLFELSEKAASEFGVSISFEGLANWILDTGEEVPADGDRPANAVGDLPVVRVTRMLSADFVSDPAANASLFSQGKLTALLDERQKVNANVERLSAILSEKETALTAAAEQSAALKLSVDSLTSELTTERAAFGVKETEFAAVKTSLETKISELSASLDTLNADLAAAKDANDTAAAEYKEQLGAMSKVLLEFGAVPVKIYQSAVNHKATLAAIQDPGAKTEYFRKYKAEILSE